MLTFKQFILNEASIYDSKYSFGHKVILNGAGAKYSELSKLGYSSGDVFIKSKPTKADFSISSKGPVEVYLKDSNGKILYISGSKGFIGGKFIHSKESKISENTQELMVAALVLLNKKLPEGLIKTEDADKIISDAKTQFKKIKGIEGKESLLDQFESNYHDLATAISTSNAILDYADGKVETAYWTGKTWHSDIKKFNEISNKVIKAPNPSDIVIKTSKKFYGISLKKKKTAKSVDPTIINKPITGNSGLLKQIMSNSEFNKIESEKEKFFDSIIKDQFPDKNISKLSDREKVKLISSIDTKVISKIIKSSKNTFFKLVFDSIQKNSDKFIIEFLNLIFRTDLNTSLDIENEFDFVLITGIGRSLKDGSMVEPANVLDITTVTEFISKILSDKLTIKTTNGKIQSWDSGSTAAKIFMTIYRKKPLIDIEIRYKGSYTANPQLQAVATADLHGLLK